MIRALLGKLGAGKSRILAGELVKELSESNRVIVGNFPVELMPWVNGVGRPQLGLVAYLLWRMKKPQLAADSKERVFRLPDECMPEFFLYRPLLLDVPLPVGSVEVMRNTKYKLVRALGEYKGDGEKRRLMSFDTSVFNISGGVCYLVDEAWKFWPAREWDTTAKGAIYYAAHSRKTSDVWWWATHSTSDIDKSIVRKTQEYHKVRNRGKLRAGIFRQPNDIAVDVFTDPPTGAVQQPMYSYKLLVDEEGVAQTYDTTGGVGLQGRMRGDMGEKRKGLPWKMVYILVPMLGLLLFSAFWFPMSWFIKKNRHKIQDAIVPQVRASAFVSTNASFGTKVANGFLDMGRQAFPEEKEKKEEPSALIRVVCRGYGVLGGLPWVFMSDGRTYKGSRHVQFVTDEIVRVDNTNYPVELQVPLYSPSKVEAVGGVVSAYSSGASALASPVVVGVIPNRTWAQARGRASSVQQSTISQRMGESFQGSQVSVGDSVQK